MGETDSVVNSMRGKQLADAYKKAEDKTVLTTNEANKIIKRDEIMTSDISTIIANTRRKLSMPNVGQLNVMVVSGLFHAPFLAQEIVRMGISPAGVNSLLALDGKRYNLETIAIKLLASDEQLKKKVAAIRGMANG